MIKANLLAKALERGQVSRYAEDAGVGFHTLQYYLNDGEDNPWYVTLDKREGLVFTKRTEKVFSFKSRKLKNELAELIDGLAER